MTLTDFQSDLRKSFVGGGPGAIVSGLVWAVAAFFALKENIAFGFSVLFLGGVLIFPVGTLLCRFVFKRAPVTQKNPGSRIVIETLPGMFVGLFIAYLLIPTRPDWVFPVAAMAVGAHYFNFRSAYGDITYWVLGALLVLVGALGPIGLVTLEAHQTALAVAAIEILFGIVLILRGK